MLKITTGQKVLIVLVGLAVVLVGSGWLWYKWKYPYGQSHCCDKCLMFALHQYAEEHRGAYPAGEATPEASLSLLYGDPTIHSWALGAETLRGKTVPKDIVQAILERGERLGPDTCGWHYVEGLTLKDDRRLALCWGKVSLDHFGGRTDGGQVVLFVHMGYEYIPGDKWQSFLEEQRQLHEERNKKREAK